MKNVRIILYNGALGQTAQIKSQKYKKNKSLSFFL